MREMVKQLGRIPCINHTDHANLARLDALDLSRTEAKHLRWWSELCAGGSLLLHRPGKGAAHTAADGISRNPEGRDRLLMATLKEWEEWREKIRGVTRDILEGRGDDEEPEIGRQSIWTSMSPCL